MARASYQDTPDELRNLQRRSQQKRDRFVLGVVQSQRREPSKAQKRLLRRPAVVNSPMEGRGSLFRYLAPYWRALTTIEKGVWADAAAYSNITNWQLFVSDNAARIRNSLTIGIPPSELWQVRTGQIVIESPATELILKQEHPLKYVVVEKIPGMPWKKQLVNITEEFSLPLDLTIRYKSDLTPVGGTQRARFYARVWVTYQGQDIYIDYEIDFDPSTDWIEDTISTGTLDRPIIGYTLFMEIVGYTGTLLFDNLRAEHGGTNWARDPRCDAVNTVFTKAFAIVPPFWIPVSMPEGASFSSVFPPALS